MGTIIKARADRKFLSKKLERSGSDESAGKTPQNDPSSPGSSSKRKRYWVSTRDPIPCLVFLLPLLLIYELGVSSAGMGAGRAGADAWLRQWLGTLGLSHPWILPLAIVAALLGWQSRSRQPWQVSPRLSLGMTLESLVFAIGLIGLSKVTDLGFDRLEQGRLLTSVRPESQQALGVLVGFLGAGIYEEAVFRLAMIPALYGILRLLQLPNLGANVLAVTTSSLFFSLAHHAGSPGELFTWYAFIFRWLAGIYFAWLFVVRGFGGAVGAHAAYDVLVGYFEWSF